MPHPTLAQTPSSALLPHGHIDLHKRTFLSKTLLTVSGLSAVLATSPSRASANNQPLSGSTSFKAIVPPAATGKSPWGERTYQEQPSRPKATRPASSRVYQTGPDLIPTF